MPCEGVSPVAAMTNQNNSHHLISDTVIEVDIDGCASTSTAETAHQGVAVSTENTPVSIIEDAAGDISNILMLTTEAARDDCDITPDDSTLEMSEIGVNHSSTERIEAGSEEQSSLLNKDSLAKTEASSTILLSQPKVTPSPPSDDPNCAIIVKNNSIGYYSSLGGLRRASSLNPAIFSRKVSAKKETKSFDQSEQAITVANSFPNAPSKAIQTAE
jgi:hypothetical protein